MFILLREQLIAWLLPAIIGSYLFPRECKYLQQLQPLFLPPSVEELLTL